MRHPAISRDGFLFAGAAFAALPRAAFGQTLPHVTVGTSPIDGAMGLVAADRAGFFRKDGLDVTLLVATGAANAAALAGGSLQFAGGNLVTYIKAHLKGVPFKIVAPGALYVSDNPTQVLVVRKDSGFKKAADLNGKTISTTSLGDLLSASTLAWIDQNGGNSATVKMIELPPSAVGAALESGRVDATTLAEPHLSEALGTGSVVVFAKIFDAVAPKFLVSAYLAMPDFIDANHDTVLRFARALVEGNAFANEHTDQTALWLADSSKVDLASIKRSRREVFATTLDPALIQVEIDALVRLKAIDRGFDATEMISPLVLAPHR